MHVKQIMGIAGASCALLAAALSIGNAADYTDITVTKKTNPGSATLRQDRLSRIAHGRPVGRQVLGQRWPR